ncbi:MAG: response regulator [Candidatus Omnitrophota bacterium]
MSEKKRILIVDETRDFREGLSDILKNEGYQVYSAADGHEALELAKSVGPDLLITDALLPEIPGGELIKQLRDTPLGKGMFFIVLTDRKNMKDYFEAVGVDRLLIKPQNYQSILEHVRSVLVQPKPKVEVKLCKRVLVVGRYEECVQEMIRQLQAEECHTDFVLFGEQVISKAVMFLPNMIIMESRMTDMGSNSIIRILRQMPQFKKTPILIFNYFHDMELKNSNVQQEELAMSFFVRACLDEGAAESMGRYDKKVFMEKVNKYFSRGTVIIIDDDEGVLRMVGKCLENEGCQIFTAKNASDGIELIKAKRPKLVILDLIMPGIDGFELLKILKADMMTKAIPVMMLTVEGKDISIEKGLGLGADDYIIKPFNMSLLVKRVKTLLDRAG